MDTPPRDTTDPLHPELAERSRAAALARLRALAVFACVVLGIVLAREMPGVPARAAFAVGAVLGIGVVFLRGRVASVVLAVAVVSLSFGWVSARLHTAPRDSLLLRMPGATARTGEMPVRVRGIVIDHAELFEAVADPFTPFSFGHTRFDLRLTSAMIGEDDRRAWEPVSGALVVHAPEGAARLEFLTPGTLVEVRGMHRAPGGRLNPGEPDWLPLARQKNSAGFLRVPDIALIERAEPVIGVRHAMAAWRYRVLGNLRRGAKRRLGLEGASGGNELLAALLLGIRGDSSDPLPTAMRRLGLAHLMAISGFHLALAAGFALFLLRAFRDLGRAEPLILVALVLLYLAVLPVRTPVLRAAFMVLGLLAASAGGRRYDPRAVLAWIAVGLLVWRPLDVFRLGFQLSLGITALLMTMPLGRAPGMHHSSAAIGMSVVRWPIRAGAVCVRCWAVGQPAVLAHFGMLSPLGWLATLIVVLPITGLLAGGYLALMLGAVWPSAGAWVIGMLSGPADAVVRLVGLMDGVPGAWVRLPLLPGWAAGLLTVAVVGVVLRPRGLGVRGWGWGERAGAWVTLAIVTALSAAIMLRGVSTRPGVALRIDTIAVGNGSCHLVRSGRDALLFDAGSLTPNVGRELLPTALRALGVGRVSAAVITHPNLDHYNALPDLVEPFGIERVYLTEAFFEAGMAYGPEQLMMSRMRELGVELVKIGAGDSFTIGAARFDVLWPPRGVEGLEANDTSVIARLHTDTSRGPRAVLFTGDAGEIPLGAVLESPGFPVVHVLELPHHGSYNPVSEALVRTLDPAVVVQSTGPSRVGDSRWGGAKAGRAWRTTATEGCITTRVYRDGRIEVRTQRAGVTRRAP